MKLPWGLSEIQPCPEMYWARGNRGQITTWVRECFELWYPEEMYKENGSCVYWTHAGCVILRMMGYRALPQVGSMQWPMQPDHGDNQTHFAYRWQPEDARSIQAVEKGFMPELHCWIALPDTNEIVDFSTFSLRKLATTRHCLRWELPDPPDYLWAKADALPAGVGYRPSMDAIQYLFERMHADAEKQQHTERV